MFATKARGSPRAATASGVMPGFDSKKFGGATRSTTMISAGDGATKIVETIGTLT